MESPWNEQIPSSAPTHKGYRLCRVSAEDMDSSPVSESSLWVTGWTSNSLEFTEELSLPPLPCSVLSLLALLRVLWNKGHFEYNKWVEEIPRAYICFQEGPRSQ